MSFRFGEIRIPAFTLKHWQVNQAAAMSQQYQNRGNYWPLKSWPKTDAQAFRFQEIIPNFFMVGGKIITQLHPDYFKN